MTQREIEIPEFPFPGGLSQAGHWLAASARLDAGYLPGGSNTRQTLAKLCRSVAHELDETAVEPTISPYEPTQWNVFDEEDPVTWPNTTSELVLCWVWIPGNEPLASRQQDEWQCGSWASWQTNAVSHWMPVTVPSPPESEES